MVSLAKYTITESRANVIVARALFFEHVFLAFLDIFELPATRAPSGPATTFRLPSAGQPADSSRRLRACALLRAPHGASQPSRTAPAPVTSSGRCTGGVPAPRPAARRGRSAGRAGRQRSALGRPKHPHDIYQVRDCQTAVAYGSGVASSACTPLSRSASCQAAQARPDLTQPSSARLGLACPGQVVRHVTGECRSPAATARPCQAT